LKYRLDSIAREKIKARTTANVSDDSDSE